MQSEELAPAHFGLVLDVTGPNERRPEFRAFLPPLLNRYLYTTTDPIDFSDPRGLNEFYEEYAVSAPEEAVPEEATSITVTFGQDGGYHAFRHVLQVGLSRLEVEKAILTATQEIIANDGLLEQFTGVTNVGGFDIFFSAYFRTTVLLNIGRIATGP